MVGADFDFLSMAESRDEVAECGKVIVGVVQSRNERTADPYPRPGGVEPQKVGEDLRVVHAREFAVFQRIHALEIVEEEVDGGNAVVTPAARTMPGPPQQRLEGRPWRESACVERDRNAFGPGGLRDRYRVIGVIAGLCGWKSENALRTAFLKRYGCSMRQWRRNHVQ